MSRNSRFARALRCTLLGVILPTAALSVHAHEGVSNEAPATPLTELPLTDGRQFLSLVPAAMSQSPTQGPCPCHHLSSEEIAARRIRFLREQIVKLRADKKHKIRVHLLNQTELRGQIVSDSDTSLTIRPARRQKDVTVSYADVSWMEKESTGGEKFRRGTKMTVVLTVTSPIWVPWFVLMLALYPRE